MQHTEQGFNPERYPPPEPILGRGRRAIGAWTKGSVRDVLCNPKYTGFTVYNRRKNPRKDRGVAGKVNPRSEWIWSSKPTHEGSTKLAGVGRFSGRRVWTPM